MAERRRTPFGELVFHYRTAKNLTQEELARLASQPRPGNDRGTVSERTVQNIEREIAPGTTWIVPRKATVAALADVFGLDAGTESWNAFVSASRHRMNGAIPDPGTPPRTSKPRVELANPDRQSTTGSRSQPAFVPDGREPQLERLNQAISRLNAGEPGVVFVAAEPGTGKTALIAHACREGVARSPDLVVLWGECAAQNGASDPHQPFRQALGLMVGDTETASPAHILSDLNADRLARRLSGALAAVITHGPGLPGRFISTHSIQARLQQDDVPDDIVAAIEAMLEAPNGFSGAQGLNEQVFRTLADYASAGPVVLVIEDLHWADAGTSALVFHLVRRLHEQDIPLLLIGSYRSSDLYQDSFSLLSPITSTIRESLRYYPDPVIDLSNAVGGGAGQAFVNAIVGNAIDQAPAELTESIFRLTGGLPLFVIAILDWHRMETNRSDALAWRPQSPHLPYRLESALSFLIDRLPPNLQTLIAIASVQGATFSTDILARVTGLTHPELRDAVDQNLFRRYQLVQPAGASYTAGVRSYEYQFLHALLQDVLYQRLTDLERDHYHAATAAAMVTTWGEGAHSGSARIAWHHARSGNARAEAEYSLQAGHHFLEMQEYDRARAMFDRIQEIGIGAASPTLVAQSLVGLGNCGRGDGRLNDGRSRLADAIDLAYRYRLPQVRANALTSQAMLDFDAGNMGAGANRLAEAVEILLAQGDLAEACRSLYLLSHTLLGIGHIDEAAQRARQSVTLAEDLGNDMLLVGSTIALANTRMELGYYQDAIGMYRFCLPICEANHNLQRGAVCSLNIALAYLELGDSIMARTTLEPVFALRGRIALRLIGAAHYNLGVCEEIEGNHDLAQEHYLASRDLREQIGQDALIIDSLAGLARVAIAQHRLEDARRILSSINDQVEKRGIEGIEHLGRLWVTKYHGWVALGTTEPSQVALGHAFRILRERVAMIADPADQRSYLQSVPSHRLLISYGQVSGMLDAEDPLLLRP